MTTHAGTALDLQKSMTSKIELQAAERFFHEQIPLTRAMGLRVLSDDACGFTVEAPVALNYNHLHTAFGGSINAVATLAGYGFVWLRLRGEAAHLVIADSSIRFLRPVREVIRATCSQPAADELDRFVSAVRGREKARITLHVRVEAEAGATAAEFTANFVALADRVGSTAR